MLYNTSPRFLREDSNGIADAEPLTPRVRYEIVAERHLGTDAPVLREREQWLAALTLPRFLVGRRRHAPRTRFDPAQHRITDLDRLPSIFRVRRRPAHHQVRAKAIHRNRRRHPSVQV